MLSRARYQGKFIQNTHWLPLRTDDVDIPIFVYLLLAPVHPLHPVRVGLSAYPTVFPGS